MGEKSPDNPSKLFKLPPIPHTRLPAISEEIYISAKKKMKTSALIFFIVLFSRFKNSKSSPVVTIILHSIIFNIVCF